MCEEQYKSSDIGQQTPFGDRIESNTRFGGGGGLQNQRNII